FIRSPKYFPDIISEYLSQKVALAASTSTPIAAVLNAEACTSSGRFGGSEGLPAQRILFFLFNISSKKLLAPASSLGFLHLVSSSNVCRTGHVRMPFFTP